MSISWIAVRNRLIYTIPEFHLKTCVFRPINIIISLNRKNYVIITNVRQIMNYLIIAFIRLIIMHENLL